MIDQIFATILTLLDWVFGLLPDMDVDVIYNLENSAITLVENFAVGSQFFPVLTIAVLFVYVSAFEIAIASFQTIMWILKKFRVVG